jgi:hypothetical protein
VVEERVMGNSALVKSKRDFYSNPPFYTYLKGERGKGKGVLMVLSIRPPAKVIEDWLNG